MKVVSLNTWSGKLFGPLLKYVSEQGGGTDIFCFQEIFDTPTRGRKTEKYRFDIFSELAESLPSHKGYFAPVQDNFDFDGNVDFPLSQGIAMFVKDSIKIAEIDDVYIFGARNSYKGPGTMPRNLQYAVINQDGTNYMISHFHGLWNLNRKSDSEERLEQSKRIKEILDKLPGKKILCGDFNLSPDTKSLGILEKGLVNLIKENGIFSTRSSLYTKQNKFADYMLVSPEVVVEKFNVPNIEISDHLPMELSFH